MNKYPELNSIRDYIRFAASSFNEEALFYGHGTDNALDEAYALVLHTLHLPYHIDPTYLDANLTAKEKNKLLQLINKRIAERIPVPYLIHEAWFAKLSFYVDERVIIPRSAIAELIETQFAPWIDADNVRNILDLCTGSGCIAIACSKSFPEAEVDASDISKDALAVAKINVLRHDVEEQVHLYESDLFSELPQKKYDIIVSNPPYVSAEELSNLPLEYSHEPEVSLHGGEEGLNVVMRILREANRYLNSNGILVVEVGNSENALIENLPNVPFTWLEFERADGGVFLLTKEQLEMHQKDFNEKF